MREEKRLSVGVLVSNGVHLLHDVQFMKAYNTKRTDTIEETNQVAAKERESKHRKIKEV